MYHSTDPTARQIRDIGREGFAITARVSAYRPHGRKEWALDGILVEELAARAERFHRQQEGE